MYMYVGTQEHKVFPVFSNSADSVKARVVLERATEVYKQQSIISFVRLLYLCIRQEIPSVIDQLVD